MCKIVDRLVKQLMDAINAPEPAPELPPAVIPVPEPAPEPRREYDRRLGAARMQMEIDRYFTNLKRRGDDDDDDENEDECLTPAAPLPDPATLRIRPEILADVQADRWRSWEWERQLQRAGGCYIPSPTEIDYMTRLLTIWGEDYLTRYFDLQVTIPRSIRRGAVRDNVVDDVRAVIAGLEDPQFTLDDIAGQLPGHQKQQVRRTLRNLTEAANPIITRISRFPSIYHRITNAAEAANMPPIDLRPRHSVADDVRAVIAGMTQPQFNLDDIAKLLPSHPKLKVRDTVNTILGAKTPVIRVIRRVSMWPTIYERIATPTETADATPVVRRRRKAHTRTTKTMRRLQHAAATNTR